MKYAFTIASEALGLICMHAWHREREEIEISIVV